MPFEHTIYLADSRNAPYGNKSAKMIRQLSNKNVEVLLGLGAKIIVVACNTATTNAISQLRNTFNIPIIGIEPAIKPAALRTQTKCIGILATKGTLSSALFHKTSESFTKEISVIEIVGEGLVPLIEKGDLNSTELRVLLKKYIDPMLKANIDYLVLGCSHYPYLIPTLRQMLPKEITIIDSGEAVARQTKSLLELYGLLRNDVSLPQLKFYTNSNPGTLEFLLKEYGDRVSVETKVF